MYRKIAPWAALSILLTAALWVWRLCDHDSRVIFLPREGPAEWILYPKPVVPYRQAVADLPAEFRRDFRIQRVPASALLSVRACKRFLASINGKPVQIAPPEAGWKQPETVEVASYLKDGDNLISMVVFNDVGPPALWLTLKRDGLNLNTDFSWQASDAGPIWQPV